MTFDELYIQHGAASFDKQIYREAMLGRAGWGLDLASGVLAFRRPHEEPLQLQIQALGTESDDSQSWLWAWANTGQGFSQALLQSALELKALGARDGIAELTSAELPLTRAVNGGRISAVASGICRAGCYFRAPYPGGALYLLIRDPRFKRPVSQPIARILRAFPMFLSDSPIAAQRAALLHYLQFYKLDVTESGARLTARSGSVARSVIGAEQPNVLAADFDAAGRLVKMEGSREET